MNRDDKRHPWYKRLKHHFRIAPKNKDELINLLRESQRDALIDADTLAMIEGVILLSELKVRDVMLPKKQMHSISKRSSLLEVITLITQSGHSRFPVTEANKDEVIGILHAKDLLRFQADTSAEFDLDDLVRQALFVPESKRLDLLLREFRSNRNHMAIVVDEYGAVAGFITLEDIMEQIIGDIEDEFDIDEEAYIKKHTPSHYVIKAHIPIEEFNIALGTQLSDETYDTLGGVLIAMLGHLPARGETIAFDNLEFKIVNADARSIKLVECLDKRVKE